MEELTTRPEPNQRTPITEAGGVVSALCDLWEMWDFHKKVDFWETIFNPLWSDENSSGDQEIDELKETEALTDWYGEPFVPGFHAAIIQIATLKISCAYGIQSFKAEKNSNAAWAYACEANHWLGILQGICSGRRLGEEASSAKFSQSGADALHVENRAMKAQVFEWCNANMKSFKSMDSAAESIAGSLVPVTFRTVRGWVGQWKKLQPAG